MGNEIIEVNETQEIVRFLRTYDEAIGCILNKLGLELNAVNIAIKLVESRKSNVILIPKLAQDELNLLHTEAVESNYEIGAILFWIMFKYGNSNYIAILSDIIPCDNVAYNPANCYEPDENCLIQAMYDIVSGEYDAFTILHSHKSDSFISCQDISTKIFADIHDSLQLYHLWKEYLSLSDITKGDIELMYKLYTALPDIMLAGGVSNYAILFNTYGYTTNTYVVTYYDMDHSYMGLVKSLYDYLKSKMYEEPYYHLYTYFKENCYSAFKMTGFSTLVRRVVNGKVFYALTKL